MFLNFFIHLQNDTYFECVHNFIIKISKEFSYIYDTFVLFLRLRGFQHGPSRAHIETQLISNTARLARDTNNLALSWVGLELTKHHELSWIEVNNSITCIDVFTQINQRVRILDCNISKVRCITLWSKFTSKVEGVKFADDIKLG